MTTEQDWQRLAAAARAVSESLIGLPAAAVPTTPYRRLAALDAALEACGYGPRLDARRVDEASAVLARYGAALEALRALPPRERLYQFTPGNIMELQRSTVQREWTEARQALDRYVLTEREWAIRAISAPRSLGSAANDTESV